MTYSNGWMDGWMKTVLVIGRMHYATQLHIACGEAASQAMSGLLKGHQQRQPTLENCRGMYRISRLWFQIIIVYIYIYIYTYIYIYITLWLFNVAIENHDF